MKDSDLFDFVEKESPHIDMAHVEGNYLYRVSWLHDCGRDGEITDESLAQK